MLRKIVNPILFLPLTIFITFQRSILSESNNYSKINSEKKDKKILVNYKKINEIISNNQELKSLEELVIASSFNLSSKISKRYPTIDLQANGLPKYVVGKNYNSNSQTTKTAQFSANPSLSIRWDLIDPLRGPEIKIARENFKISKNNFDIKKKI